jgi:hypothetical protein
MAHALAVAVLLPFLLSSCLITYKDFPADTIQREAPVRSYELLSYEIDPFPFPDEGGEGAVRSVFNNQTPFLNTVAVKEMPGAGVFCRVTVQWNEPGWAATIFRYLSLLTLTALPSWNTEESYVVHYRLYIDGEERQIFTYKITRSTGLWIGLLPIIWLNLSFPTQAQAFESTAFQFFVDAKPIFTTLPLHEHILN